MNKNNFFKLLSFIAFVGFLSACGANVGMGRPPSAKSQTAAQRVGSSEMMSSLPAQELEKGACVIFLWGMESSRPLIFTQNVSTDSAFALIDNKRILITRDQASELVIPGFYARQRFLSGGMSIDVRLKPGEGRNLYEGIKIPTGILSIKKADGSETIVSASGLLGCNFDNQ